MLERRQDRDRRLGTSAGRRRTPDPWRSRWYSHDFSKEEWPCILERSDTPSRVISTVEAVAVLMGLKMFHGDEARGTLIQIQMIPSFTDNRGSTLNKLMTNKYPSSAIFMELACCINKSIAAVVERAPRTANYEADGLANGNTRRFDISKRIVLKESEVWWDTLPEAPQKGREVERECRRLWAEGAGLPDPTQAQQREKARRQDACQGSVAIPV